MGTDPERHPLVANPVLRVLLPFAAAYVLSYLYRSVNAVIATDLAGDFALSAAQLGLLTSAYLFAFAAFQLPLGLLLDRFGPRRTDSSLLLLAACGAVIFATADRLPALIVGRALIGLGVSGCLMSGIKANVLWFAPSRLATVNGWLFFAGGVGLVLATFPVEITIRYLHWPAVFEVLALLTLLASAVIFFIVPERSVQHGPEPIGAQLQGLWEVFRSRHFWQIALCATVVQSTHMAVQGLWAGPWLRDVAGLDREGVALHLLLMALATTAGFLFWGTFATWLSRRGVSASQAFTWGSGVFLVFQLLVAVGDGATALPAWIGYGFFGTAGSLCYAILPHRFSSALAGRVNTALNSMVFTCAFAAQWALGVVISQWPATASGYDPRGYRVGFGIAMAIGLCAWGWMVKQMRSAQAQYEHWPEA